MLRRVVVAALGLGLALTFLEAGVHRTNGPKPKVQDDGTGFPTPFAPPTPPPDPK